VEEGGGGKWIRVIR
jgi:hypothetical protein